MDSQVPRVYCPKCNSDQLTANQRGYKAARGFIGAEMLGPSGAVLGAYGADQIWITCLNCGHRWQPGMIDYSRDEQKAMERTTFNWNKKVIAAIVMGCLFLYFSYWVYNNFSHKEQLDMLPEALLAVFAVLLFIRAGVFANRARKQRLLDQRREMESYSR